MAKLNMYCIFDQASAVYDRPFCALADAAASRSFSDIAMDAEHPIGRHPEHFSLVRIGVFDDNNAVVSVEDKTTIITGLEAVAAGRKIKENQLRMFDQSLGENGNA